MSPLATVQSVLARPFTSAVFFVSGVLYDTFTLTRIDRLQDNLILLFYLVALGILVVLTGRQSMATVEPAALEPHDSSISRYLIKAEPYYPKAMQFLFGGLFSAYAVFYSRSATLTGTGVFLGLLVLLLMANEFLRDRLLNVRLLVALFALASFSFFTFFLPVMVGVIGTWVFLLGAALTVGVTLLVVQLISRQHQDRSQKNVVSVGGPAIAFIGLLIGFYFLNWIPPVPLSMKFGGMYREVQKQDDRFVLSFDRNWYQVWKRSQNPFPADEPVYCFTAIFAPVALNTTVYHHWYFRTNSDKPFTQADRIPIKIAGGREGGYRAYTFKQRLDPGDWRVDVETEDGRVVGQVSVVVAEPGEIKTTPRTLLY
jgi:MFS family permease